MRKRRNFDPGFFFKKVAICPEGGEILPLPKEGRVTNCLTHHVKCDIYTVKILDENPISWIRRIFSSSKAKNLREELIRVQEELDKYKSEVRVLNLLNIDYKYSDAHIDPNPSDIQAFCQMYLDLDRARQNRIKELEELLERYES